MKFFRKICDDVARHLKEVQKNGGDSACLHFWCHRGKHRSVATAEAFKMLLPATGFDVDWEHVSLVNHRHGHRCSVCANISGVLDDEPKQIMFREWTEAWGGLPGCQ